eukprot:363801-Chlamydomonas_euryale.AAC.24
MTPAQQQKYLLPDGAQPAGCRRQRRPRPISARAAAAGAARVWVQRRADAVAACGGVCSRRRRPAAAAADAAAGPPGHRRRARGVRDVAAARRVCRHVRARV